MKNLFATLLLLCFSVVIFGSFGESPPIVEKQKIEFNQNTNAPALEIIAFEAQAQAITVNDVEVEISPGDCGVLMNQINTSLTENEKIASLWFDNNYLNLTAEYRCNYDIYNESGKNSAAYKYQEIRIRGVDQFNYNFN